MIDVAEATMMAKKEKRIFCVRWYELLRLRLKQKRAPGSCCRVPVLCFLSSAIQYFELEGSPQRSAMATVLQNVGNLSIQSLRACKFTLYPLGHVAAFNFFDNGRFTLFHGIKFVLIYFHVFYIKYKRTHWTVSSSSNLKDKLDR
ncbi:hypothetical protein DFJ58DRAFT_914945 [Suillus subalutaceus]|uniref:uncharacterized protein n=1 Tax=Suillus subalutaceus TaxID=48586 RepID=UPI001B86A5E1|nr:uncharacterized protein DFJ58DRAFT_914945 [Suillus subalutaceus]KAG1848958.1 hypothetical protein DFJ58DRAFT_914945 [Suillus subalutaceus]